MTIKTCFWILFFFGGLKISTICWAWNGDYEHPKLELQNLQHISFSPLGKRWNLVHAWTITWHGSKYCNGTSNMNQFICKSNKSICFHKRMRLSPYYLNPIILFWFPMIFF
jgi:hypothetical protein